MSTTERHNLRGLFITHEGFGNSIFRTQVIEHCLSMEKEGIAFDVLTYETFPKHWPISLFNLRSFEQSARGLGIALRRAAFIYFPFSTLINMVLLGRDLARMNRAGVFHFLHARSDYTAFIGVLLKPFHKLPVVWDCRGDSSDELDFSLENKRPLIRLVLGPLLKVRQRVTLAALRRYADGAVFVSEALRDLHAKDGNTVANEVIPCPVPEEIFSFDPGLRRRTRDTLSIPENARVFLYSGSTTGYQGLADQVELYRKLLVNPTTYVIIATTEVESARAIFSTLRSDRLIIRGFNYLEMNGVYNASDFAFMLRAPRMLNYVSSPTKFGEYCLTGLPVIHNNTIDQVSRVAKSLGIGRALSDIDALVELPADERRRAALQAHAFYSRRDANQSYLALYKKIVNEQV
jgi:glycosyltransferase involved in cell wall biosynthesis